MDYGLIMTGENLLSSLSSGIMKLKQN